MDAFWEFVTTENKFVTAILILVCAYVLSLIAKNAIDFIFVRVRSKVSEGHPHMLAKTKTLRLILKAVVDVFLLFSALLMILSHFGLNIVPLLTGAGIVGLAFSFGAQTVFKDYIVGFYILLEDQFSIGDKVKIGDVTGEVYKMTLRVTVLKDAKSNLIFISNSQIESVTKLS